MARTIAVAGTLWSDTAKWDEGLVPTSVDDVVARGGGDSGPVTNDITNQACRSLDFTNYANTWTFGVSVTLNIGSVAAPGSNVALRCVSGMTVTTASGATIGFVSVIGGLTITSAGKSLPSLNFNGLAGGWTLQDDLATAKVTLSKGTLNTNGKTVTTPTFVRSGTTTAALTLVGSTINLTSLSGIVTVWGFASSTGLTLSAAGSTINITGLVDTDTRTFAGGGLAYGTLNYTVAAQSGLTITGANSFEGLNVSGAPRTLTLPAAVTTTVSGVPTLTGTPNGLLTIVSSASGSAAVLSVSAGTIRFNHCSIKDLTCQGGATFEAYDCANVSGNTGITFKKPKTMALCGVG